MGVVLLLFFLSSVARPADPCLPHQLESFLNNPSEQLVTLPSGRELGFLYEPPAASGGESVVLIHGLGDDLHSLDRIASGLRARGYGVLRVDLHGHGKTLERELALSGGSVPREIPYEDQVQDLAALIAELGLKNIRLVGHSYGGAIALALGARLGADAVASVKSVHLLAPYLMRLDGYAQLSNPVYQYWKLVLGQGWMDSFSDPYVDGVMTSLYTRYLQKKALAPALVDAQVKAIIAVTKGIRNFDVIHHSTGISRSIPVQVFIGEKDQFVPARMLRSFASSQKGRVTTVSIPGGTHFFPQEDPDLVVQELLRGFAAN
jgi:pimeloyl-ACP methyl ester carboxylesterase